MTKVVFNQDGSIKAFEIPQFVNQGDNGHIDALKVEVAVDGVDLSTGYYLSAVCRTPYEKTVIEPISGDLEGGLTLYEKTYPNAKYGYLTLSETRHAGKVLVSIEIKENDNYGTTLYSFPFTLIVNETPYDPTADAESINNAQYYTLMQTIANYEDRINDKISKSDGIQIVPNIRTANPQDYGDGNIVYCATTRTIYMVDSDEGQYWFAPLENIVRLNQTAGILSQDNVNSLQNNPLTVIIDGNGHVYHKVDRNTVDHLSYYQYVSVGENLTTNQITITCIEFEIDTELRTYTKTSKVIASYNKTQIDILIAGAKDYTDTQIGIALASVYKPQGSASTSTLNALTKAETLNGNVYNMTNGGTLTNYNGSTLSVNEGDNVVFVWNNGDWYWDDLASFVDLTPYVEKTRTIAGIDLQDNITAQELTNALVFATDEDIESIMED